MTPEEFDNYEMLKVASHEAGHVAIAASFGQYISAMIWREGNHGDESLKNWRGQAECLGLRLTVTPIQHAAIGIGGVAAECLMQDSQLEPFTLVEYIDLDVLALSATDWEAMHCVGNSDEFDYELMELAASIAIETIRHNMALYDWIVAELVIHGSVTNGMVEDFVRTGS